MALAGDQGQQHQRRRKRKTQRGRDISWLEWKMMQKNPSGQQMLNQRGRDHRDARRQGGKGIFIRRGGNENAVGEETAITHHRQRKCAEGMRILRTDGATKSCLRKKKRKARTTMLHRSELGWKMDQHHHHLALKKIPRQSGRRSGSEISRRGMSLPNDYPGETRRSRKRLWKIARERERWQDEERWPMTHKPGRP